MGASGKHHNAGRQGPITPSIRILKNNEQIVAPPFTQSFVCEYLRWPTMTASLEPTSRHSTKEQTVRKDRTCRQPRESTNPEIKQISDLHLGRAHGSKC